MEEVYDSVQIGGFTLTEPSVVLTNIVVVVFALFWGTKLGPMSQQDPIIWCWRWFFILTGIATLFGALSHGTREYGHIFGLYLFKISWIISAAGITFAQKSAIDLLPNEQIKQWLNYFIIAQLVIFSILAFRYHDFNIVNINTALGIAGTLLAIHIFFLAGSSYSPSWWVIAGVLVLPSILVVKGMKMSLGWFNHHDIAHFIMILSMYLMYVGAKQMFQHAPV